MGTKYFHRHENRRVVGSHFSRFVNRVGECCLANKQSYDGATFQDIGIKQFGFYNALQRLFYDAIRLGFGDDWTHF